MLPRDTACVSYILYSAAIQKVCFVCGQSFRLVSPRRMLETCRNVNPDYFSLLLFTKCVNPIYSGMRNTTSISPFNLAMSALI